MTVVPLHVEDSARDARPLVLLHAFPLSSAMWAGQYLGASALGADVRVLAPDQRGFGRSPLGDDEPTLDHVADDLAALLDHLELDRVVLGGLSMGGYAAMAFLRRHPGRVLGLVLADTKATADPDAARDNRHRIADTLAATGSPQVLLEDVLPGLTGETTKAGRPQVAEQVAALVSDAPPASAAWVQRAMAVRPDSRETLAGVDVPALVVVGDQDVLTPQDDAQAMVDALPDARLVVLPRAGHLSALEAPEEFNAVVRSFLATL